MQGRIYSQQVRVAESWSRWGDPTPSSLHGKAFLPHFSFTKTELFDNGFAFSMDGKHFESEAFRKRWHHNNLPEFPSSANLKWPAIDAFSNFLRTKIIWCLFSEWNHLFKFHRRCVDALRSRERRNTRLILSSNAKNTAVLMTMFLQWFEKSLPLITEAATKWEPLSFYLLFSLPSKFK